MNESLTQNDAPRWPDALAAWAAALGPEHVLAGSAALSAYLRNASGLERSVPAALLPASAEQVVEVVRIAGRCRTPLYPISRGCNWGLGSRLPVRDGTAILDLRRMDRIREINAEHGYAVVEPGVTQAQLHAALAAGGHPYLFNVTGSGRDTSLIGNALDRGVGYFSSRVESLSGLEVVLGNGTLVRTGFGHYAAAKNTYLYRYGIGPDLAGLFFQSNFGVVTAAAVELIPRGERSMSVVARIRDDAQLPALIDRLAQLRRSGALQTAVHVANRPRLVSSVGPMLCELIAGRSGAGGPELRRQAMAMIEAEGFGAWSAVGGLVGSPRQLKALRREIGDALRPVASVTFLTDELLRVGLAVTGALSFLPAMRRKHLMARVVAPLYGLSKGVPTDEPLKSLAWSACPDEDPAPGDPDAGHAGVLYVLPIVPMTGRDARVATDAVRAVFAKHGFEAYITYNLLGAGALEGVINLAFDRRDAARTQAAQRCIEEAHREFLRIGMPPYRVGIQGMAWVVDAADPFWQTVRALKDVFDPAGILSPGRYNLA
jgi:4-cresol dehydrogenase (hydroxylating)